MLLTHFRTKLEIFKDYYYSVAGVISHGNRILELGINIEILESVQDTLDFVTEKKSVAGVPQLCLSWLQRMLSVW
jgi:hypothetical protein